MLLECRVEDCSPQNISGATQQNTTAALSWATEVDGSINWPSQSKFGSLEISNAFEITLFLFKPARLSLLTHFRQDASTFILAA